MSSFCRVAFGYVSTSKTKIEVKGKSEGNHEDLMEICTEGALLYILFRFIDGDQESRRVKFVGITFVGESVGGMKRGRVAGHGGQIRGLFGQMNIEIAADDHEECSMELIQKKCKLAGGADYDTGSNAGGYKTRGGTIKSKSLRAYQSKEKLGNISGVVFETSALPKSTPMDLSGRPTVASASEAQKNTKVRNRS